MDTRKVPVNFNRQDMPETLIEHAEERLSKLPPHVSDRLAKTGAVIHVGESSTETDGWYSYASYRQITKDAPIADGRSYRGLSWYDPGTNEIFISASAPTGSANVYTHELGHAVDFQWTGTTVISKSDEWKDMHTKYILDNPLIQDYYRHGPTGDSVVNGRAEAFAEGYSRYLEGGKLRLTGFLGSKAAAEEMIAIWTKYGIVR